MRKKAGRALSASVAAVCLLTSVDFSGMGSVLAAGQPSADVPWTTTRYELEDGDELSLRSDTGDATDAVACFDYLDISLWGGRYEAENGEFTLDSMEAEAVENASDGMAVDGFEKTDGAGVEFPFTIPADDTYYLTLGYTRINYEIADQISVYVDGERAGEITLKSGGNTGDYIESDPVEMQLAEGSKITVKTSESDGDQGLLMMDYLKIQPKTTRVAQDSDPAFASKILRVMAGDEITVPVKNVAEGTALSYESSAPEVASVDAASGKITAAAAGEAVITATAGEITFTCKIQVVDAEEELAVPVSSYEAEEGELIAGDKADPVIKSGSTFSGGKWVEIYDAGTGAAVKITPDVQEQGEYSLTMRYAKGSMYPNDSVSVYVNSQKVGDFYMDSGSLTATRNTNTIVTELKPGDVVMVRKDNGQNSLFRYDYLMVSPVTTVPVRGLTMDEEQVTVADQETYQVKYTLSPEYATDDLVWSSDNTDVAEADGGMILKMDFTDIKESEDKSKRIFTIELPDQNLVTVSSREETAQFAGSKMQPDITKSGDQYIDLTTVTAEADDENLNYAFLSNGKVAAGIRSNAYSTSDGDQGAPRRVIKATDAEGSSFRTSIRSGSWVWRREDYTKKFITYDEDGNAGDVQTKTYEDTPNTNDMPLVYVALAENLNGTGTVDWQDAGIRFRDIMETAIGMDKIPDAVVQRLIMPQAGEGNYPFISSLDETKRVYLNTDGLGQIILDKYHNLGYWGDFSVYDDHLGGLIDFRKFVSDATNKYNGFVGVHSNFTEVFAKTNQFSTESVQMSADGLTPNSKGYKAYGFFLHQCYMADDTWEALSGQRRDSMKMFVEDVPDLGFIYSDVYYWNGWRGQRLIDDYTANGLAYFVEWPYISEEASVWAHWAVEKDYSPASNKGYSSDIARFIFNHTKDRWDNNASKCDNERVPNSCNLLMGADTTSYEGWVHDGVNQYDYIIEKVFNNNLPTKYMQHFPIIRMDKDAEGWGEHIWFEDGLEVYRDADGRRVMEKDGKLVYTEDAYLIPWDEGDMQTVNSDEDKEVNYGDLREWTVVSGNPEVRKNDNEGDLQSTINKYDGNLRNYELIIPDSQETEVTQTVTGLNGGEEYAASVMVEVEQGKERMASIKVDCGGETVENYTMKSILEQYDAYDSKAGTYMLRMRVVFKVPEGEDSATIRLCAAEGEGKVRFDNVRVYDTTTPEAPEDAENVVFYQDFEYGKRTDPEVRAENKATYESYYPFNLGSAGGIREARAMLQSRHDPYTQNNKNAGWDPATIMVDMALDGDHSLSVITDSLGAAFQTTPQTIRFENGHTYRISFIYQNALDDTFAFVLGADQNSEPIYQESLKATPAKTGNKTFTYEFTSTSDQTWFSINRVNRDVVVSENPNPFVIDNILVEDLTEEVEPSVDKSGLEALYDQYKDLDMSGYTKETWEAFADALKAAEKVLKDEEADQDQVDAAKEELQTAADGLRVSKSNLEYWLNSAKTHVANGDTAGLVESVQQLFDDAIAQGEAVMAMENPTKDEVFNTTLKLMLAVQALDMKAGDKTDLEMALELADMIDPDKYTEDGQEIFLAAKEAAEAVMADGDAMQADVDSAWSALVDAMSALRLKADKAALEDLLDSVAGLDLSQYTEESAQAFSTALAAANAVLADITLTADDQQKVDDAVQTLAAAKEALVLKDDASAGNEGGSQEPGSGDSNIGDGSGSSESGNNAGGNNADTNAGGSSNGNSAKAAKTGDTAPVGAMLAVMVLAVVLAGGAKVLRRR